VCQVGSKFFNFNRKRYRGDDGRFRRCTIFLSNSAYIIICVLCAIFYDLNVLISARDAISRQKLEIYTHVVFMCMYPQSTYKYISYIAV